MYCCIQNCYTFTPNMHLLCAPHKKELLLLVPDLEDRLQEFLNIYAEWQEQARLLNERKVLLRSALTVDFNKVLAAASKEKEKSNV